MERLAIGLPAFDHLDSVLPLHIQSSWLSFDAAHIKKFYYYSCLSQESHTKDGDHNHRTLYRYKDVARHHWVVTCNRNLTSFLE